MDEKLNLIIDTVTTAVNEAEPESFLTAWTTTTILMAIVICMASVFTGVKIYKDLAYIDEEKWLKTNTAFILAAIVTIGLCGFGITLVVTEQHKSVQEKIDATNLRNAQPDIHHNVEQAIVTLVDKHTGKHFVIDNTHTAWTDYIDPTSHCIDDRERKASVEKVSTIVLTTDDDNAYSCAWHNTYPKTKTVTKNKKHATQYTLEQTVECTKVVL